MRKQSAPYRLTRSLMSWLWLKVVVAVYAAKEKPVEIRASTATILAVSQEDVPAMGEVSASWLVMQ